VGSSHREREDEGEKQGGCFDPVQNALVQNILEGHDSPFEYYRLAGIGDAALP
jgi:hypothetical protein